MEWICYRGAEADKKKQSDELVHHGILGQKWGVRRYQNEDGTYTEAGKKRYFGDAKEKLQSAWKKVTDTASDLAFETEWAVKRAGEAIKDTPKKIDYAIKDSKLSQSRKEALQKYRTSKDFGWDGTGKPQFGLAPKTVAERTISGNAGLFFGPYHDYKSLKRNGCRSVDIWMACKQYLTNFNDLIYSDRNGRYDDPISDDYMWSELLNANGTIDIEDEDELAEYLKKNMTNMWSQDLSDKDIESIVKEYREIAQIWNDMVAEINDQGLGELFFNSDNKALNYPLPDGSYADLQYYGESLGQQPSTVKEAVRRSKENVGQLKLGYNGKYLQKRKGNSN